MNGVGRSIHISFFDFDPDPVCRLTKVLAGFRRSNGLQKCVHPAFKCSLRQRKHPWCQLPRRDPKEARCPGDRAFSLLYSPKNSVFVARCKLHGAVLSGFVAPHSLIVPHRPAASSLRNGIRFFAAPLMHDKDLYFRDSEVPCCVCVARG